MMSSKRVVLLGNRLNGPEGGFAGDVLLAGELHQLEEVMDYSRTYNCCGSAKPGAKT